MQKAIAQIKVRSNLRAGNGGWVNGTWYPDMSGTCTGTTPPTTTPPPPTTGGGWVNGTWYPDMSGTC